MTKLNVYIDFEAISPPFIYKLSMSSDLPFMYTIGIFNKNNEFVTKTRLINLKEKTSTRKIHGYLFKKFRRAITNDIYILLENDSLEINPKTIKFIAWDNYLETQLLHRMFGKYEVNDLASGNHISLDVITKSLMEPKEYFLNFIEDVKANINSKFFNRRGLGSSGALASIAGYILYSHANHKKNQYYFETDIETLKMEVIEYSKDDVVKMGLIVSQGDKWLSNLTKSIVSNRKLKMNLWNEILIYKKIIEFINKTKNNFKIEDYITQLKNELEFYEICISCQNIEVEIIFKLNIKIINNILEFIKNNMNNVLYLDNLKKLMSANYDQLITKRNKL